MLLNDIVLSMENFDVYVQDDMAFTGSLTILLLSIGYIQIYHCKQRCSRYMGNLILVLIISLGNFLDIKLFNEMI